MAGFTGFVDTSGKSQEKLIALIKPMIEVLGHRSNAHEALWADSAKGVALAQSGAQSVEKSKKKEPKIACSPSGRFRILIDGFLFNIADIKRRIESEGDKIPDDMTSLEVLGLLIERVGFEDGVKQIDGAFALVVWDQKEEILHCARDRFGKKPLYLGWAGQSLLFASELKAARAYTPMKAEVNAVALKAYVRYGYVPAPYCIYDGFVSVPAGCMVSITKGLFENKAELSDLIESYWNCIKAAAEARVHDQDFSEHEAINSVRMAMKQSVAEQYAAYGGEDNVGVWLSGGLDSTAITALLQSHCDKPVKSFTLGYEEEGYDEAKFAAQIAGQLGTNHHEIIVPMHEAKNIIPDMVNVYDEPFSDVGQLTSYLVSRFSKNYIDAVMTGDGGDELFGGYNRHSQGTNLWQNMQWLPLKVRNFVGKQIGNLGPDFWSMFKPSDDHFGERMVKVGRAFSASSKNDLYKLFLSLWSNPSDFMQGTVLPEALGLLNKGEYYFDGKPSFSERMMAQDSLHYLPNDVLTRLDRSAMNFGLETSTPMLDPALYSLAWQLPHHMKVRGREGKWILRQLLYRYIPKKYIHRPRVSMTVPIGEWLRGDMRDWAEALLDPLKMKKQGYLNPEPVQIAWKNHLEGRINNGYRIWAILMFQMWLEKWMR